MQISSHLLSVCLSGDDGYSEFPGTILQLEPSGQREHLDRAPRYLACVPEADMVGVIESFYMCHVPTAELCRGAA